MKTYEAMFLLDAGNPDFEEAATPVRELLKRAEAETLSLKPWDERRLAYEIKGRRRGLYVLTYFKADPARLEAMEHDIQLDERILRAMILSADHVDEKVVQAETPATQAQSRKAAREAEEAAKEKPEEKAKEKPEEKAKEEPEEKAKEKSEEKAKEEPEEKAKEKSEEKPEEESEEKAKEKPEGKAAEKPAKPEGAEAPVPAEAPEAEAPKPPDQATDTAPGEPGA